MKGMQPIPSVLPEDAIPDAVVVRIARDRDPHGDDLVELLSDKTRLPFDVCEAAVRRAHAAGYLDYHEVTENLVIHGRPTVAGLALLENGSLPD
jgi:hypothetical protein